MTTDPDFTRYWKGTWRWSLVLALVGAGLFMGFGQFRSALGVMLGTALFLADIYLLRLPLDLMLGRVARGKRPWLLALTAGRLIALGLALFLLVRFRIAGIPGMFIGVTIPLLALVSVLVRPGRRPQSAG